MRRRYWIALGVVAVAIVAAGSAVAATKLASAPTARSNAIISDAAGRLHVTPQALSSALEKALDDQVDAAVAAGRMTKQEGNALKARIDSGRLPLVGGFGFGLGLRGLRPRPGGVFGLQRPLPGMFGAGLAAVTSYLGITPAQLRSALVAGKSLAQIATDHGKTADGLVSVLVSAAKSRLDKAVSAKRLSSDQEHAILGRLQTWFRAVVERTLPAFSPGRMHPGFGFGPRFRDHARWFGLRPGRMHGQSRPPALMPAATF
jgi:hypothetical protein